MQDSQNFMKHEMPGNDYRVFECEEKQVKATTRNKQKRNGYRKLLPQGIRYFFDPGNAGYDKAERYHFCRWCLSGLSGI